MATKERLIIESMLRIPDKEGKDVDFNLNSIQSSLDHSLTGRDIVTKIRQPGISSYFLARYTVLCLSKRNTRAVVISHDKESTQRMLAKVHYYLENIRGPAPVIKNNSKNELTFEKTGSAFYIGTAGARKFGRGDTITNLHCSEVAYWPDPKSITSGLFQAVPFNSGEIAIESTGNGVGNWFHRLCMNSAQGKGRYRLHFFGWLDHAEYELQLSAEQELEVMSNLNVELKEPELVKLFNLSPGRIAWRRLKLEELDYDMTRFEQEYPLTLDQCFQATGNSLFSLMTCIPTDNWEKLSPELYQLKGHPRTGYNYIIGGDVGAGTGNDNSVLEVFCLETMEQVAEWASNRIPPDVLGARAAALGIHFNEAFMIIESNNHGIVTLSELAKVYPNHKIYKAGNTGTINDLGHRTSQISKPLMVGRLRAMLSTALTIHSPLLKSELSTFVEREDGKLAAQEGCNDDRVIAAAKAVVGFERALLMKEGDSQALLPVLKDPFSLDSIIDELKGRMGSFPIASQVATDADFVNL